MRAAGERLGDAKIQAFLATREVVVLAMVQAGGGPMAMPMWVLHDPDALYMISVAGLAKVRSLVRDPRVCVVAETGTRGAAIRSVTVHGRATPVPESPGREALARRFLDKYHPDLERLWGGPQMPADRVMFRIEPDKVRSRGLA